MDRGTTWPRSSAAPSATPLVRVLVEPQESDPLEAQRTAAAIDRALDAGEVEGERFHHGYGPATWEVIRVAAARGRSVRAGLEDATTLPDGTPRARECRSRGRGGGDGGRLSAVVRPATRETWTAVLELWGVARTAAAVTEDTPEAVAALIDHDPGALLVAELDGRVVGALVAAWDGWRGNVYRLAVLPEHRRTRYRPRPGRGGASPAARARGPPGHRPAGRRGSSWPAPSGGPPATTTT